MLPALDSFLSLAATPTNGQKNPHGSLDDLK
jgi:hypothetical protein